MINIQAASAIMVKYFGYGFCFYVTMKMLLLIGMLVYTNLQQHKTLLLYN